MPIRNSVLALICFLAMRHAIAQDSSGQRSLSQGELVEIVLRYHPVAKQASLHIEKAKTAITTARGAFDPLLTHSAGEKTFDGTDYYRYSRPSLTIPTWLGVDIVTGLEYLSGKRTDPQETLGESNYIGISVPLARNLLMDKRRAALKTAKIYRSAADAEQAEMLNDLLLEAITSYWEWVKWYKVTQIVQDAVEVSEKRLSFVRTAYLQGDRPAIDTTEALAQLQSLQLMYTERSLQLRIAALELSAFLWTENDTPAALPEDVVPQQAALQAELRDQSIPVMQPLLDQALQQHPSLKQYSFKLDALEVKKRLSFQQILPQVNFRYNHLGKGYDVFKASSGSLFENNYRYGISVALPLRLSEGRGEYKKARLDIASTQLEFNRKQVQVGNKLRAAYNELTAVKEMLALQERNYRQYLTLQRGEETMLMMGESSLFLVNNRENKTLEALQKLTELKVKYLQCRAKLYWTAGNLKDNLQPGPL